MLKRNYICITLLLYFKPRQIDPHVTPLGGRRRNSLSLLRSNVNENREKLGVLAEDPAEEDNQLSSDDDSASTGSGNKKRQICYCFMFLI